MMIMNFGEMNLISIAEFWQKICWDLWALPWFSVIAVLCGLAEPVFGLVDEPPPVRGWN
jgi:hypothetical protein